MEKLLEVEIITPKRIIFSSTAKMAIAPGEAGTLGILPLHISLLSNLKEGNLIVRKDTGEDITFHISDGFIKVKENKVIILVEQADRQ